VAQVVECLPSTWVQTSVPAKKKNSAAFCFYVQLWKSVPYCLIQDTSVIRLQPPKYNFRHQKNAFGSGLPSALSSALHSWSLAVTLSASQAVWPGAGVAHADSSAQSVLTSSVTYLPGLTPTYLQNQVWEAPPLGNLHSVLSSTELGPPMWLMTARTWPCLLTACLSLPSDKEALECWDWVALFRQSFHKHTFM
jgi:hypothetical protein